MCSHEIKINICFSLLHIDLITAHVWLVFVVSA
jgi:hypothetical protein